MVESAFGLIILLFVIFGIIEYGQLIMARQLLNNAARSGRADRLGGPAAGDLQRRIGLPFARGVVDSTYLNNWITKAMTVAPLSNVTPAYYGSNADGSANTSIAWNSTTFGQGFYIDLRANYIPLFSGNRIYADSQGNTGAMVGSLGMRCLVYIRAEANN